MGLIGIDGSPLRVDQAERVRALVKLPHTTLPAKNVMAMIKNALRVPTFAPVLA